MSRTSARGGKADGLKNKNGRGITRRFSDVRVVENATAWFRVSGGRLKKIKGRGGSVLCSNLDTYGAEAGNQRLSIVKREENIRQIFLTISLFEPLLHPHFDH